MMIGFEKASQITLMLRRSASDTASRKGEKIPRWDLAAIYQGFDSRDYQQAKKRLHGLSGEVLSFLGNIPQTGFDAWLKRAIAYDNEAGALAETLMAYAYASYSTATRDQVALSELNALEEMALPLKKATVLFRNAIAARRDEIERLMVQDPEIAKYGFYLREELLWQSRQMTPELENLAADLQRSGGDAWTRLQESVSSNTSVVWDEKKRERKTVIQLRTMAYDGNRVLREKAFRKELEAWKSVEIPIAAALNGVKGWTVSMNRQRGWEGAVEKSIQQARISRKTLDSLIAVMEESLPLWRRYLKAKAKLLGIPKLGFYDLFGPLGSSDKKMNYAEAKAFIIEKFTSFSAEFGEFAAKAFAGNWIDAEPREGKVGGAYCISFPEAKASRVLCNFEGSFSSLTTVAHELGHGYHHDVIKDLPYVQTHYPMTLAETASIFAETIVFEESLKNCEGEEKLALLELHLMDGCQVIVDILSRFHFEKAVLARRAKSELSSDEFCELMIDAQKKTYGDALDEKALHPYMWAVKSHYYSAELSYYNYPYAFGQLFGVGLYAKAQEQGPSFAQTYRDLLRETGRASAVDITKAAGFDIESKEFWRGGIAVFEKQVDEFEHLAATIKFSSGKTGSKRTAAKKAATPKKGAPIGAVAAKKPAAAKSPAKKTAAPKNAATSKAVTSKAATKKTGVAKPAGGKPAAGKAAAKNAKGAKPAKRLAAKTKTPSTVKTVVKKLTAKKKGK